jgi:hypothetical protein
MPVLLTSLDNVTGFEPTTIMGNPIVVSLNRTVVPLEFLRIEPTHPSPSSPTE